MGLPYLENTVSQQFSSTSGSYNLYAPSCKMIMGLFVCVYVCVCMCLCVCCIDVLGFYCCEKHHDHGNSYKKKKKTVNLDLFSVQRFRLLLSWWETWQLEGYRLTWYLEKELKVLHPNLHAGGRVCYTRRSLSIWDHKACFHSDTFPPKSPHILLVPLYGPSSQMHDSTRPFLFKSPQVSYLELGTPRLFTLYT